MIHKITRQCLYHLAWQYPMRHLGPRFGISDTAVRKRRKDAGIPLPPAGFWAKKAAGKKLNPPLPLPLRFPGSENFIDFESRHRWNRNWREELVNSPIPPPPYFEESLESAHQRVIKMVGKVPYPTFSSRTHPQIAKLFADDEARKKEQRENRYAWRKPRFDTPIQKRRLRIINALFLGLGKLGGKPSIRASSYEEDFHDVSIRLGDSWHSIHVVPVSSKAKKAKPRLKLVLGSLNNDEAPSWEDTEDDKIEHHLTDIAIALLYDAEVSYRKGCQRRFEYDVKAREDYLEELEQQRLEAERLAREEAEAQRQAHIAQLLLQAENLQKAQTIRAYVSTIQNSDDIAASREAIERWATWAMDQADSLDPIKQQSFMTQLNEVFP